MRVCLEFHRLTIDSVACRYRYVLIENWTERAYFTYRSLAEEGRGPIGVYRKHGQQVHKESSDGFLVERRLWRQDVIRTRPAATIKSTDTNCGRLSCSSALIVGLDGQSVARAGTLAIKCEDKSG